MDKKLTQMTWVDMRQEMSIAGSPEKIAKLGKEISELISKTIDSTNRAELTNMELALQRVLAEIRLCQRMYDNGHKIG